ncbi:RimK/LysX family protein [Methyloceanibacter sp. wino2]|uniref:ATP-dependent zinc protease family protein n=1 Tax=Methyloceanibacter sp. wino2 TaxID=2170729 RepID=UPI000D3E0F55|nr:RimK/LysX family protein [Methyloceanibacter sp. wino2]
MKKRVTRSKRLEGREIGWREHVALPELGIASMRAKIDTGARTSALNTDHMERFERNGQHWISFTLPAAGRRSKVRYEAQLEDVRNIKNTGGVPETRPIIKTTMVLGKRAWVIEISLADRENMKFDMIVGRTALRTQRLIVNSGRSYLAGDPIGPAPLELHET